MSEAKISEIFISYQGEGPFLGVKQVFVRFFGCSTGCVYCDTNFKKFTTYTKSELIDKIKEFHKEYHSVSITGGEPLEQVDFLADFLPALKFEIKKPVYLETNGILHANLSRVINNVDIIAMDIKLPSSTAKKPFWDQHRKFLEIAVAKNVFVKMVVTSHTMVDDLLKARDIIKQVAPKIIVVLQPVDPIGSIREPSREYLSKLRNRWGHDNNLKVIAQYHKKTGMR